MSKTFIDEQPWNCHFCYLIALNDLYKAVVNHTQSQWEHVEGVGFEMTSSAMRHYRLTFLCVSLSVGWLLLDNKTSQRLSSTQG